MQPMKHPTSNLKLIGNDADIGDLEAFRYTLEHDGRTVAVFTETRWKLSDLERKAIADGGDVVLTVMGQAFAPVSLQVSHAGSIVPDSA